MNLLPPKHTHTHTRACTHVSPSSQSCLTISCPPEKENMPLYLPRSPFLYPCRAERGATAVAGHVHGKRVPSPTDRHLVRHLRVAGWLRGKTTRVKLSLTTRGDAGAHPSLTPHSTDEQAVWYREQKKHFTRPMLQAPSRALYRTQISRFLICAHF